MINKPLVTVIIPIYNREKYIKNCLDIVLNQTYSNLEIIAVNDGSTDGSVDIVKQYPKVKLVEHEKNKGLSAARNTGMKIATGKYIHFMDDDDIINPEFYENLVKASEETQADMACCGVTHQKQKYKSQSFKKREIFTTLDDKMNITYVGKWGYVWRYLFLADFLRKNNLLFIEGVVIEDLPFSFQAVYYANKLVVVPETEYIYVYNENSIINSKNPEAIAKRRSGKKHAKQFILDFAKKNGDFRIPGVNSGKWKYWIKKFVTGF
jgi:CDP-glycerol glycerophosphotransferase